MTSVQGLSPTNYLNGRIDINQWVTNANGTNSIYDNNTIQDNSDGFVSQSGERCTDGKDDGKIGLFSKIGHVIKGAAKTVVNMVKGAVKHPIKTALAIGACCIPVVGPVIAGGLACYGLYSGTKQIVQGIKVASAATTDAEAKEAWQNIGGGAVTVGMSAYGLKGSAGALKNQIGLGKGAGCETWQAVKNGSSKGEILRTAAKETGSNFKAATYDAAKNAGKKAINNAKGAKEYIDSNGGIRNAAKTKTGEILENAGNKLTEASNNVKNYDPAAKGEALKVKNAETVKSMETKGYEVETYKDGAIKKATKGNEVIEYAKNGSTKKTIEHYNSDGQITGGTKSAKNTRTGTYKSETLKIDPETGAGTLDTVKWNQKTGSHVKTRIQHGADGSVNVQQQYSINGKTIDGQYLNTFEKAVISADSGVTGTLLNGGNAAVSPYTGLILNKDEQSSIQMQGSQVYY